jgi:hypothetical protein
MQWEQGVYWKEQSARDRNLVQDTKLKATGLEKCEQDIDK